MTEAGARIRVGVGARTRTGVGVGTEVGAGTGARASRTALRILYKLSSEYLGTLLAAGGELARGFPPKGPASWLDDLLPDSRGGEESGEAMEGVTEGVTEECSRWGRPQPRTKVILTLTF